MVGRKAFVFVDTGIQFLSKLLLKNKESQFLRWFKMLLSFSNETWLLCVFDHRCLQRVSVVCRKHLMNNHKVPRCPLGVHSRPLIEIFACVSFGGLGTLCMAVHHLPFRTRFAHARRGWKKGHGDQAMNWRRGMKLVLALASVGTSCLPG